MKYDSTSRNQKGTAWYVWALRTSESKIERTVWMPFMNDPTDDNASNNEIIMCACICAWPARMPPQSNESSDFTKAQSLLAIPLESSPIMDRQRRPRRMIQPLSPSSLMMNEHACDEIRSSRVGRTAAGCDFQHGSGSRRPRGSLGSEKSQKTSKKAF